MKSIDSLLDKLLNYQLFKGTSRQMILQAVNESGESVITYERGDAIFTHDSFERRIGCIIDGEVAVKKHGCELDIRMLSRGDSFGLECIYSPRTYYPVELVAVKQTKVLFIDKASVYRLMMLEPAFAANFITMLSENTYYLYNCVSIYTGGSAENRLANYLKENFGGYKTFELKQSYSSLAQSLDIGRASLYRAFDSLIDSGAVEKEGKYIRLLNENALDSFL